MWVLTIVCFLYILAHLSWELKWALSIAYGPSVHLSVHMFVNFSHFHLLFQNHWPKKTTNNKIKTKHPWVKGIQVFFKWRAPTLFQRDIYNSKSTRPNLEIFSRTIGLISNKGSQVFASKDHSIPKRREQFYHNNNICLRNAICAFSTGINCRLGQYADGGQYLSPQGGTKYYNHISPRCLHC